MVIVARFVVAGAKLLIRTRDRVTHHIAEAAGISPLQLIDKNISLGARPKIFRNIFAKADGLL